MPRCPRFRPEVSPIPANDHQTVVGPVIARQGGFAFDTWEEGEGLKAGFVYRRVEHARYARNYELMHLRRHVIACDNLVDFMAEMRCTPGTAANQAMAATAA
jgi:hypothetical protein